MSVEIPETNPVFTLQKEMQAICKDFLKENGFNYFQYLRCFADGSISLITNVSEITELIQLVQDEPVVFSSFKKEHKNLFSYWFLWDEELPEEPVKLVKEKFNLHNGLSYIRRNKEYYDMIAVALPEHNPNAGSFYLNKQKLIENFIKYFTKNYASLIAYASENPVLLPEAYRDVNYKELCISDGRIEVYGNLGTTYITVQEAHCLNLLLSDYSHKEIANTLDISARTVETYINRVKQRTGYNTKKELEVLISICP